VKDFFDKLFGKRKSAVLDVETAPLSEEQLRSVSQVTVSYTPPQILVASGQSTGMQREHNEDTIFTLCSTLANGENDIPFGVFIVADGMGGHQHGEVASSVATRAMAEHVLKKLYYPMVGLRPQEQNESLQEILEAGVREAHQTVHRRAPGGGTTLTTGLLLGEQILIAHVGDSRAYFIYPDGRMLQLTQDHSLVRRLVELGQLTEAEAVVHPQRNVLYRAIGQNEPFHPDVNNFLFPHPGYMLICSDGLWGVLPDTDIFRIVNAAPNPSQACYELVQAANNAGGPDNISVILVQYVG
jgi:serine/threonine protein phosphatase PrpC